METTTLSSSARREGDDHDEKSPGEGDKNESIAAPFLERAAVNRVVHAMREYHRSCDREIERRKRNGRKAIAIMRMKNEAETTRGEEKDDDALVAVETTAEDGRRKRRRRQKRVEDKNE